jgi:hypothetical protein
MSGRSFASRDELAAALRGRSEVSRAFLVEQAGERPTIVLELDDAPEELAAYRDLLHDLFAAIAAGLGEHAHGVSFGAGPPDAVADTARRGELVYERMATS